MDLSDRCEVCGDKPIQTLETKSRQPAPCDGDSWFYLIGRCSEHFVTKEQLKHPHSSFRQ